MMNDKDKRKLSDDELEMVSGGVGVDIEPEPASFPDPKSFAPQSSAPTDPEIKRLNYRWDK